MPGLRSAATVERGLWTALLALALALRLLTPAGFMPAFDHGAVAIVVCPDSDSFNSVSAAHHHHHGGSKAVHQPCPFAAASGLGAVAADFSPLFDVLIFVPALLLGRTFRLL